MADLPRPRPVPDPRPDPAWLAKWLWDNDPRSDGCVAWESVDGEDRQFFWDVAARLLAAFTIHPR